MTENQTVVTRRRPKIQLAPHEQSLSIGQGEERSVNRGGKRGPQNQVRDTTLQREQIHVEKRRWIIGSNKATKKGHLNTGAPRAQRQNGRTETVKDLKPLKKERKTALQRESPTTRGLSRKKLAGPRIR